MIEIGSWACGNPHQGEQYRAKWLWHSSEPSFEANSFMESLELLIDDKMFFNVSPCAREFGRTLLIGPPRHHQQVESRRRDYIQSCWETKT